jgi:hypothetical protein
MDDYESKDRTSEITALDLSANMQEEKKACWNESRRLAPKQTTQLFLFFNSVETENEKKIILDDYSADITLLTSVTTGAQMNTLACVMEQLLIDKESDNDELIKKAATIINSMFNGESFESNLSLADTALRWYEEIRPIDAFCCCNRMRGLSLFNKDGDLQ